VRWIEKARHGLIIVKNWEGYQVRQYADRLAIARLDEGRLTWEEVQKVKEHFWCDRVAIEVYPAKANVVNLRHTRHLWWVPELEEAVNRFCAHPEFGNYEG